MVYISIFKPYKTIYMHGVCVPVDQRNSILQLSSIDTQCY